MKIVITGATRAENDKAPEVHLCTISTSRPEIVGRAVLECLSIAQKEPNLCDSIDVQEGSSSI
jgi:hypothetical protein